MSKFFKKNILSISSCAFVMIISLGMWVVYSQQETSLGKNINVAGVLGVDGDVYVEGVIRGYAVPTHIKWTNVMHHGNFGGYNKMEDWIQSNGCAGYHVCDPEEVTRYQQHVAPLNLPSYMWVQGYHYGGNDTHECSAWTGNTSNAGCFGGNFNGYAQPSWCGCNGSLNVLCCKY